MDSGQEAALVQAPDGHTAARWGWARRIGVGTLAAFLVVASVLVWWRAFPPDAVDVLRTYRSSLAQVTREEMPDLGPRVERWSLVDERGEHFTGLWRAAVPPTSDSGRSSNPVDRPWTVVLLGGFYAGDQATLLLPETLGVHMLAVDWPWHGPRRLNTSQFVRLLPDIHQMLMQSPAVLALGVDAVSRQPEVDASRIALIGASLGVPSTVAALELTNAPAACALVYGGADIEAWMSHELPRHIWPKALAPLLASIFFDFVRPLEPSLHREAAVRARFLILNARDDQFVPTEVTEALRRALPHATVRWKDGRHISSRRNAQLDGIAAEVEAWLESRPGQPESE
jgi:hypothetical protein